MSKRDGGPCSNCGGTVYYEKGSCVACTGERASNRQREQLKELRQLRADNAYLIAALHDIVAGKDAPCSIASKAIAKIKP